MGSLGPHDGLQLRVFGAYVSQAFNHVPYHVGSSLTKKANYRDVDVRLILPDDEYESFFGIPFSKEPDPRKLRLTMWNFAWTTLGRKVTGLPVDFQFQQQTLANTTEECKGPRSALLLTDDDLVVARVGRAA